MTPDPLITVDLNGEPRRFTRGATCTDAVAELTGQPVPAGDAPLGIALAVDGELVPRGLWAEHTLTDGARVEVVTAVQGG